MRALRSRLLTWLASSLASCSAWVLRVASIARISVEYEDWVIATPHT
jgi:hypothetical protein